MSDDDYGTPAPAPLDVVWEGPCRPVPPSEKTKRDGRKVVVVEAHTVLFPLSADVLEADTVETSMFTGVVETVVRHHQLKKARLKDASPGA